MGNTLQRKRGQKLVKFLYYLCSLFFCQEKRSWCWQRISTTMGKVVKCPRRLYFMERNKGNIYFETVISLCHFVLCFKDLLALNQTFCPLSLRDFSSLTSHCCFPIRCNFNMLFRATKSDYKMKVYCWFYENSFLLVRVRGPLFKYMYPSGLENRLASKKCQRLHQFHIFVGGGGLLSNEKSL